MSTSTRPTASAPALPAVTAIPASACADLGYVKDLLKRMRRVDDNIPHALNTINTDDPAACAHLFRTLTATYADRDALVQKCMGFYEREVQAVRRKLDASPAEEFDLRSHLYAEEAKLNQVKKELTVEEIIRERTLKAFHTRCHMFDASS